MRRRVFALNAHAFVIGIISLAAVLASNEAISNTIIVGDGGSVVSAVAAAHSGDTIEIQSNQTFTGTVTWFDKFLTIQAATGFSPTIKGPPNAQALGPVSGRDGSGAGGALKGITLLGGINASGALPAVSLGGTLTTETYISFDDVTFNGSVSTGGTGEYYANARFSDCTFLSEISFSIGTTGNAFEDVLLERSHFAGLVIANAISESGFNLLAVDNVLANAVKIPGDVGIHIGGALHPTAHPNARIVNTTVVGYDLGLEVITNAQASLENMLLHNTDDIGTFASGGTIKNSLISDGTFAGMSGNFGGIPLLGTNNEILH
jgi:hypothetical protein